MLWIHTDVPFRAWDIPELITDHGLLGKAVVTLSNFPDETMAWAYSACDVTLGIGSGEGFGFPLAESLACGTPAIHGEYGGATDWMPNSFLVKPKDFRYEGMYCNQRPVFDPQMWEWYAQDARRENAILPPCLEWKTLWHEWDEWIRRGL